MDRDVDIHTFSIVSLGCPKNLVDSENIVGTLQAAGLEFIANPESADYVIINTCGFLNSARDEAKGIIADFLALKKARHIKNVAVTGCVLPVLGEQLCKEFPNVDIWAKIGDVNALLPNAPQKTQRRLLTAPHVAFLRIADGCNRCCAYCLIPSIRGPFVSVPEADILSEAKRLRDSGVTELILIAQETTNWGTDICGQPELAALISKIQAIGGFSWIRLMYTYPMHFSEQLISIFGTEQNGCKVLPYIDIPLQHANDTILKRMNRTSSKSETEDLLHNLRERIPNLVLRTSFIVGFPGESEEMFDELLLFAKKWRFERAGVFIYSKEQGTKAASFEPSVPNSVKQKRQKKLYAALTNTAKQWAKAQIGKTLDILIDANVQENLYVGRSFADSPENDPVVYVTSERPLKSGIVKCEIVDAQGLDLIAVP